MSEKGVEDEYQTDFEPGQDNVNPFGLDLHNPVFFISALIILVFVVGTLIVPETANALLDGAKNQILATFDWLFMTGANIFVLFCLALLVSPLGKIRLGGQDAKPDFKRHSWFAMLFAAGMGIGLMFWAVAEPVGYFTDWFGTPMGVEEGTREARAMAMSATMFHWGLHPWAIYGVVALSLAFFSFNKGMPLTIRSAFYPLLGERVWGWPGHIIDTVAVVATLFGLATSLGLGAQQAASGMDHLFGIGAGLNTQIAIIVGVTALALVSVMRGLDGGVKVLSNFNMILAAILLLFVIVFGATMGFFTGLVSTTTGYFANIIPLSNPVGRSDEDWMHAWTVFYWAWWISWSPFVGMFIARVSRGRTVREFLLAVLVIPTVITILWMTAFGGNGLEQAQNEIGVLKDGIVGDSSMALFHMLDQLPLANLTAFLAIVLVLVFFVTSSDSGSLVIDSITAGGKLDSPQAQRVFWVVIESLIAGALLFGGGDNALYALQAAAIIVGLPFTIVLLFMCVSLYMGLSQENRLLKQGATQTGGAGSS